MKRKWFLVLITEILMVSLVTSCISVQSRAISQEQRGSAAVVGRVEVKYTSYQPFNTVDQQKQEQMAYAKLMEKARKQYKGDIDVVNVTASGGFHGLTLIPFFNVYSIIFGNFQTVTATGDVIEYVASGSTRTAVQRNVEGALEKAAEQTLKSVPARSKIAIVYITAQDRSTTEYIAGELEYIWVNAGYTIIDRSQLDRIRREQNFQMSGEVDDNTAVSIGKIIGANIIVTGRVDGEGSLRRLRLRALDTQTAQVVGVASERI
jgi:hypothetical protein